MLSIGSSAKAQLKKEQRKQEPRIIASQASIPSASSSKVGTSLPRTARTRLRVNQCGMRKRDSSKLSAGNVNQLPRLGGSGSWAAPEHDSMIAPVLYSDGQKSTLYASLSSELKAPSSSPGTDKSLVVSVAGKDKKMRRDNIKQVQMPPTFFQRANPRSWPMIQQPQHRGLTMVRPARFRTMVGEAAMKAARNGS